MAKNESLAIQNPAIISLEVLSAEFQDLLAGVEEELVPDQAQTFEPIYESAIGEGSDDIVLAKRDRLAELLDVIGTQAQRIRNFVRIAEERARHEEAKVNRIKWSLQVFMEHRGIKEIPGLIRRFALHKKPERLVISAESQVPEKYWDEVPIVERRLNIPGAYIESGQRRLAIK